MATDLLTLDLDPDAHLPTPRTLRLVFPPDRRPRTSGDPQCYLCGKPLAKKLRIRLMIHVIDGGMSVLHPHDEDLYESDNADLYYQDIGTYCARALGKQWTVAMQEAETLIDEEAPDGDRSI